MKHIATITRIQRPAKAENLLAKQQWLENALLAAEAVATWVLIPAELLSALGDLKGNNEA